MPSRTDTRGILMIYFVSSAIFFSSFFSSLLTLRSILASSGAGGRCSGTIPREMSVLRTVWWFVICSTDICHSVFMCFSLALWMVISVAKSLALRRIVGMYSAIGFPSVFHRIFISAVLFPPKNAASHLLRMSAKF